MLWGGCNPTNPPPRSAPATLTTKKFRNDHYPFLGDGRQHRCEYCSLKGIRKATKWYCRDCNTYLCHKGTDTDCFLYHLNHCWTPSLFFSLLHWQASTDCFYPHLTFRSFTLFHWCSLTLSPYLGSLTLSLTSAHLLSLTGALSLSPHLDFLTLSLTSALLLSLSLELYHSPLTWALSLSPSLQLIYFLSLELSHSFPSLGLSHSPSLQLIYSLSLELSHSLPSVGLSHSLPYLSSLSLTGEQWILSHTGHYRTLLSHFSLTG